jgi:hypothetical protein
VADSLSTKHYKIGDKYACVYQYHCLKFSLEKIGICAIIVDCFLARYMESGPCYELMVPHCTGQLHVCQPQLRDSNHKQKTLLQITIKIRNRHLGSKVKLPFLRLEGSLWPHKPRRLAVTGCLPRTCLQRDRIWTSTPWTYMTRRTEVYLHPSRGYKVVGSYYSCILIKDPRCLMD